VKTITGKQPEDDKKIPSVDPNKPEIKVDD
jgi:hypothetical protein